MQRIVERTLFRLQRLVNFSRNTELFSDLKFRSYVTALMASTVIGATQTACTTIPPPVEEYAIARSAMEAARSIDAGRFAGNQYHRAMEAYLRAEILYRNREYHEARDLFEASRVDFEKAENIANVQRKKNGETL